jgi:predicted nucleotidyltransferase
MTDRATIRAFAERVAAQFRPQRIILFGSHAHGTAGPDSDVDLLIVISHEGKGWHVASEIRRRLRPPFPTDLLVRSPEQLRERLDRGDGFLQAIMEEGEILYEA